MHAKFYNPSKLLTVDEVIVLLKVRFVFRKYIPKNCKHFGIKIYELCDLSSCTYDMSIYLGKDWRNVTQMMRVACESEQSR